MLESVLPFSPDLAKKVSEYCERHSEALPRQLHDRWEWTTGHYRGAEIYTNAEMMSSKLQGQWMIWMAQWIAPKRVLEIGTFTGFSALAWYEGTKASGAEIVTLDVTHEFLEATAKLFKELGVDDRIILVEGPAAKTLSTLEGEFDLIFFDADKENQKRYLDLILEQRLLSPKGVILVDNVLARGLTTGKDSNPHLEPSWRPFFEAAGETQRKTNQDFLEDPRVDTLMLPVFDGVTQMKWKEGLPAKRG
ncbi:hypothetical protein XPA_009725 [Xanthoria parietina]